MLYTMPVLQSVDVDFLKLPVQITETHQENYLYVLGDLHGNAFKAFHFARQLGLITLSEKDLNNLIRIYKKENSQLTSQDITDIKSIFANVKKVKNGKICFIGDTICDRAWNDGIFFLLMNRFRAIGLDVEVAISNHDMEFVLRMEAKNLKNPIVLNDFNTSLSNLNDSIDKGLFTQPEINNLYNQDYLSSLKAISYALNGNNIMILTHAAIGINVIKSLAKKWALKYEDATAQELAGTIDRINAYFQYYAQKGLVHTLVDNSVLSTGFSGESIDPDKHPLEFMIWNREYGNKIDRRAQHNGYSISWGHGHDKKDPTKNNNYNLDEGNDLGARVGKIRRDDGKMHYLRVENQPRLAAKNVADNHLLGIQEIRAPEKQKRETIQEELLRVKQEIRVLEEKQRADQEKRLRDAQDHLRAEQARLLAEQEERIRFQQVQFRLEQQRHEAEKQKRLNDEKERFRFEQENQRLAEEKLRMEDMQRKQNALPKEVRTREELQRCIDLADGYISFMKGVKDPAFSDVVQEVKMNDGTASVPGKHLRVELKKNADVNVAALEGALRQQGIVFESLSHGNPFLVIRAENNANLRNMRVTALSNGYLAAKNAKPVEVPVQRKMFFS